MFIASDEQRASLVENIVASGARISRFRCSLFSPLSSSLRRPQGALGLQALAGGSPFFVVKFFFCPFLSIATERNQRAPQGEGRA